MDGGVTRWGSSSLIYGNTLIVGRTHLDPFNERERERGRWGSSLAELPRGHQPASLSQVNDMIGNQVRECIFNSWQQSLGLGLGVLRPDPQE